MHFGGLISKQNRQDVLNSTQLVAVKEPVRSALYKLISKLKTLKQIEGVFPQFLPS